MSSTDLASHIQDIVLDEILPHTPDTVWKTLTTAELIGRWLMPPAGFEAVVGNAFTYKTTPAGAWDGTIHCRVLEVVPGRRLAYAWQGGDEGNAGYGSPLDTVVTWTLTPVEAGTRLRLVHSGFKTPRNDTAYRNMSDGWTKVLARLDTAIGQEK